MAAFDALNFDPKKLLYIVHEGSILRNSLETFQTVFGGLKTYGMYSGEAKEKEADFVFSTNISIALEFNSVIFDIDNASGKCVGVERISVI